MGDKLVIEAPLEENLVVKAGGEVIWKGTRKDFVSLWDSIQTATPSVSNQYGKVCVGGMKPDTEYLIIRAHQ